ncbi:MAG TPA: PilN domain-containing protein, partial [Rhodocyclaceae bacterium]|nr:PilN domain-containing protein [Rhodocyclaceae bacterium]
AQIEALLARKQVIESLQGNRAETVHMFNELARRMPEGVHLNTVKQTGSRVLLTGYAQSNARVSHLMRSLEESPYLAQPGLVEVRAATANNRRLSQFSLNISLVRPAADESKGEAQ